MGAYLGVQVPLRASYSEQSEAQRHKGDRVWEESVEHKRCADEQESDTRHYQAGRVGRKPRSSDDQSEGV
ncbi:MAG: hypothetical protein WCH96_13315 [Betaproteobacteria bacterium]